MSNGPVEPDTMEGHIAATESQRAGGPSDDTSQEEAAFPLEPEDAQSSSAGPREG